jgi:hypothetical protein
LVGNPFSLTLSPWWQSDLLLALCRVLEVLVLLLMLAWILNYLGGFRLTPEPLGDGSTNSTRGLFNLHPLLLTFSFVICMSEALLAYRAPLVKVKDRYCARTRHMTFIQRQLFERQPVRKPKPR